MVIWRIGIGSKNWPPVAAYWAFSSPQSRRFQRKSQVPRLRQLRAKQKPRLDVPLVRKAGCRSLKPGSGVHGAAVVPRGCRRSAGIFLSRTARDVRPQPANPKARYRSAVEIHAYYVYRSALETQKLVFCHASQPLPSATSKLAVTESAPHSEHPRLIEREPQRAATIQSP